MSWRVIAKRDVLDPYRSHSLWVFLAVFVALFGFSTYLQSSWNQPLAAMHVGMIAVFVPMASLVVGYQAIVKRRENGALRVALSFPHTRREVVLGTAVGRSIVAAVLITTGFLAALVVYLVEVGVPDFGLLALGWGLGLLYGLAMIGFAVGVSATARTMNQAVMACFGALITFLVFWSQLPGFVRYVLNGFAMPRGPPPEWTLVFDQLNPMTAYQTTATAVLSGGGSPESAFYVRPWFGVLVMLGWLVVPLLVGAWRFDLNDL